MCACIHSSYIDTISFNRPSVRKVAEYDVMCSRVFNSLSFVY